MLARMTNDERKEQLRGLPAKADEVWQGGLLAIPGLVKVDDGTYIRPFACLWVSTATAKLHITPPGPAEAVTPAVVVDGLVAFARREGYRPGRVMVAEAAHAAAVTAVVGPAGVAVDVVDRLAGVEYMADHLAKTMGGGDDDLAPPGLADDPAITPDRLAGFADAAAAFYRAAPWKRFGHTDLLRVVSPTVAKPLRFVHVLGGGGQEFGLSFFASVALFRKLSTAADPGQYVAEHPLVGVTFDTAEGVPPADVAAWKRLKLPTAKRGRTNLYPFPVTFDQDQWLRPSAADLATMEGLLRAVTTVADGVPADGRWSAQVPAGGGAVAFALEVLRDGVATKPAAKPPKARSPRRPASEPG